MHEGGIAMIYLAIDNGVSGGLALLSAESNTPPIDKILMPVQKSRKGREINIEAVKKWMWVHGEFKNFRAVIEEPGGSKSAQAAASMAASFGALRGALQWAGIPTLRITPQKWQKCVLGVTGGESKALALTKARELWPEENWLASEKCRKPHDGMIDAALLGYYARCHML